MREGQQGVSQRRVELVNVPVLALMVTVQRANGDVVINSDR